MPDREPEYPRDDGVNGDHDRNDQYRHDAQDPVQTLPLSEGVAPAKGENRVRLPPEPAQPGIVAEKSQVRNQREEKIEAGAGEVDRYTDEVPQQRRLNAPEDDHVE